MVASHMCQGSLMIIIIKDESQKSNCPQVMNSESIFDFLRSMVPMNYINDTKGYDRYHKHNTALSLAILNCIFFW